MLSILKILFLISVQHYFIQCIIPTLKVSKLDRKLIARKRQDTLDMCRLFTENEKFSDKNKQYTTKSFAHSKNRLSRRAKRSADSNVNPMLNMKDINRVEQIVDRLYDDVLDNGEKVSYRHRSLDTPATLSSMDIRNISGRRFNFAPAELLGPLKKGEPFHRTWDNGTAPGIPWHKKWKHGIVPYFIDSKTYDSHLAEIITKAFDYFERATCIRLQRLRERPTDRQSLQEIEWLYITNPSGIRQCVHSNEQKRNIGVQLVVFGYDCLSVGEIAHEIMHILGFPHEHTRPDRDQYITIFWDNIKPGYKKYFAVRANEALTNFPYDYSSVLHYPKRAFSRNGQATIVVETGIKLGQRESLSETDIEKVGLIFGTECVERNKQYLLKTCPSVVKSSTEKSNVTESEILDYFKPRLWPYGVVNYKIEDKMEFSAEERENIKAVIRHIEKETCIEFQDLTPATEHISDSDDNDKIKNTIQTSDKSEQIDNERLHDTENEISQEVIQRLEELAENDLTEGQDKYYLRNKHNNQTVYTNRTTRDSKAKRTRRAAVFPIRRHAANIIVLKHSPEPGCICPKPGRPNGNQVLTINSECFNSVNDLLHLFVHILGLDHQHNMHDRDSYLHILWENLSDDVKDEMQNKLPPAASAGFPYDYQSVTHYPWLQIKNGVTNIMYPIWNDGWSMGHWQGLSSTDVQKLNLLYYQQCFERKQQANSNNM